MSNWEIRECKDYPGRCYYYNQLTGESTWFSPSTSENKKIICLFQIIIKYYGCINCVNRYGDKIRRSRDEAVKLIRNIREKLSSNPDSFLTLAEKHTDYGESNPPGCLGWLKKGTLPKFFEERAFRLKNGEISDYFETDLGFHIIMRVG